MAGTLQSKRTPKYAVIHDHLLRQIEEGRLAAGEQLPTCVELCDRFGVSAITANRAVDELVAAGLVRQYAGRGSFVTERPRKTLSVGLLLSTVGIPPMMHAGYDMGSVMIPALDGEAHRRGAQLVMRLTATDDQREADAVEGFLAQGIDALIATPIGDPLGTAALRRARDGGLPLVFLDRHAPGLDAPCVMTDNHVGALEGTRRLLDFPDAEPFFLGFRNNVETQDMRLAGFAAALAEKGMSADGRCLLLDKADRAPGEAVEESIRRQVRALAERLPRRLALFAVNAIALAGAWRALADEGRALGDMAFACFDDPGALMPPEAPLVKVIQPLEAMAKRALAAALSPGSAPGTQLLPPVVKAYAGAEYTAGREQT
jgi:DNA-binding LacI/PurR family transcriptional regulator